MSNLPVFALLTDQGTAMAETALCCVCIADPVAYELARASAEAARDWNGKAFVETTDNPEIACTECGRKGRRP